MYIYIYIFIKNLNYQTKVQVIFLTAHYYVDSIYAINSFFYINNCPHLRIRTSSIQ